MPLKSIDSQDWTSCFFFGQLSGYNILKRQVRFFWNLLFSSLNSLSAFPSSSWYIFLRSQFISSHKIIASTTVPLVISSSPGSSTIHMRSEQSLGQAYPIFWGQLKNLEIDSFVSLQPHKCTCQNYIPCPFDSRSEVLSAYRLLFHRTEQKLLVQTFGTEIDPDRAVDHFIQQIILSAEVTISLL